MNKMKRAALAGIGFGALLWVLIRLNGLLIGYGYGLIFAFVLAVLFFFAIVPVNRHAVNLAGSIFAAVILGFVAAGGTIFVSERVAQGRADRAKERFLSSVENRTWPEGFIITPSSEVNEAGILAGAKGPSKLLFKDELMGDYEYSLAFENGSKAFVSLRQIGLNKWEVYFSTSSGSEA